MLMKDNKKNMAAIIVDRINGKPEEEKERKEIAAPSKDGVEEVSLEMDGPAVAADEVFAAIDAKDKPAFIEAMRSMVQMCMSEE